MGGKLKGETQTRLWPSQIRIARLVAEGKSNKEIAHETGLSYRTVKTHVSNIYAFLGFNRSGNARVRLAQWVNLQRF